MKPNSFGKPGLNMNESLCLSSETDNWMTSKQIITVRFLFNFLASYKKDVHTFMKYIYVLKICI